MNPTVYIATYQIGKDAPTVVTAFEQLLGAKKACAEVADEFSVGRLTWKSARRWAPGDYVARKANMVFRIHTRILNGITQ